MTASSLLSDLQHYVEGIINKHCIPAISLAIWHNKQLHQAAAGILNVSTGVVATADSIFQVGSIAKVFTTCLIMQLVDEGKVELDVPVKTYLRDFQIADVEATHCITVRQLLNHTSGIAGDYFPKDSEAQGNAIARYIDRINLVPLVHSPGAQFSYSNAAFAVAGRLVEIIAGCTWYQAMDERIFQPLGMTQSIADPKEVLRYRCAMGHIRDSDNPLHWCLQPDCYSTLGLAPAGTTLAMSASDLITFVRVHLNTGKAAFGKQWLPADKLKLMQSPDIALPPNSQIFDSYWGLGWAVMKAKRCATKIVWHSGQVGGQMSMLRFFPERDIAFAVLINGRQPDVLDDIVNDLSEELVGIHCKEPDLIPAKFNTVSLKPFTGTFNSFSAVYKVALKEGGQETNVLAMSQTDKQYYITTEFSLFPLGEHIFAVYTAEGIRQPNLVFIQNNDDNTPTHLFYGGRLNSRIW